MHPRHICTIREREFSTAGGTVTKLHSSLDSGTVDKLIFVNKWLKTTEVESAANAKGPKTLCLSSDPVNPAATVKQETVDDPAPGEHVPQQTGPPLLSLAGILDVRVILMLL